MEQVEKKKTGRPTSYSDELAKEICKAIATTSKSIIRLCKENEHWPVPSTIYLWRIENEIFSELYTKARMQRVEVFVDETIDIADDTKKDTRDDGSCNSEWLNRSRLRIDTRKWYASKLAPKLYGDKIINEHTGANGKPIEIDHNTKLTAELVDARIEEMSKRAK
jgi:hypothetical protein